MPHVNIWIRKDDLVKWESIKDKPSFLHNALHWKQDSEILRTPGGAKKFLKATSSDVKTCKHGADPRFCKHAKPGKVCK